MKACEHPIWEREAACYTDGLCPVCLKEEIDHLRNLIEELKKDKQMWYEQFCALRENAAHEAKYLEELEDGA